MYEKSEFILMVPKGLINVSLHVTVFVFETVGTLAMDLLISHSKGSKHLINYLSYLVLNYMTGE